ncbi:ATP-dependent zinc metalloprotease FtsH [Fulvivirga sp. 29W222]|uniref:ATP-dependent zinc metalloprotease FtsH n=1 Tax=Fulvivirga marina TaxID=2494733 RepID=A0A937KFC9_9BACT|nr:ATP-dependent zinc metalloprotease FtsH [Fulvivirga marina]MBL6448068.1 ATP-dependent zinc metalloprotease FtsH [Fulvivirga marina]
MARKNQKKLNQRKLPTGLSRWVYVLFFMVMAILLLYNGGSEKVITWKRFEQQMLLSGDVSRVEVINERKVQVYIKSESLDKVEYNDAAKNFMGKKLLNGPHYYFNIGSVEVFHQDMETAQEGKPKADHLTVIYKEETEWLPNILGWLIPFGLIILFSVFLLRGASSGMKNMGRSVFNFGQIAKKEIDTDAVRKTTFDDVAGLEEAKEEIYELVKFLKAPQKYSKLGAKIPKGILLVGPPGTGKTLLAKAVAGEAGVPFFSLSGSEFVEMFVGVGAARMRDLFEKAKAKAPCIIFIDEIDTVGRNRGKAGAFQANDERENTLNQLLAELDGFDSDTGVIVLAATNRGDVLDPALLRPGRFDRHIHLELPGLKERAAIFAVHMMPLKLNKEVDNELLAAQTPGFSGADIANICNEAALIAARREKEEVESVDFMDAIDRVIGGLEKRSKIITPAEKERIAFHEAGHVTASWFLEHAYPVLKVSIIPRGKSLGAAWYLPEERQIITRSEFFDAICGALGGRVSESIFFDEVSSNAVDDLEKVTRQAYAMVTIYGLSDKIRNISYYDSTGQSENALHKPYSEKTAEKIDQEVQEIVDEAYENTRKLLSDHKEQLEQLARQLIKKEILYKEDIEKILGKRTFKPPVPDDIVV